MKLFCCAALACTLVSCAQMKSFQAAAVQKAGALSNSVAGIMPGRSTIPVVKARPGDMRDLKTGDQQALAFEKGRKTSGGWALSRIFGGSANFQEPSLPAGSGTMDGDLLPPKM